MTASVINGTEFDQSYNDAVAQALDKTYGAVQEAGVSDLDLATARIIILSDQHKGARNGADDFRDTEPFYNAALAYYFDRDYTLIGLGDCEELWEERPGAVIDAYGHTLSLTARFHQAGRYQRVWGNHDDEWRSRASIDRHLVPVYQDPKFAVPEGLLFRVMDAGESLGSLFLVHGHQGTLDSDRFSWFSRLVVRYIWRPIQRLTNWRTTTPATSWELRQKHNIALYSWSAVQTKTILIAGHTHRPVFEAKVEVGIIERELAAIQQAPADTKKDEQIPDLQAELAWAQEQTMQLESGMETPIKPSYFNSGCCVYSDASLTGIEITDGEIRLVRWPNSNGETTPEIWASASLRSVLAEL